MEYYHLLNFKTFLYPIKWHFKPFFFLKYLILIFCELYHIVFTISESLLEAKSFIALHLFTHKLVVKNESGNSVSWFLEVTTATILYTVTEAHSLTKV